jgi:hypothetical protein
MTDEKKDSEEGKAWLESRLNRLADGGVLITEAAKFRKNGKTIRCESSISDSPIMGLIHEGLDPVIVELEILTLKEVFEELGYKFFDVRKSKSN